jgi:hypothetical protein
MQVRSLFICLYHSGDPHEIILVYSNDCIIPETASVRRKSKRESRKRVTIADTGPFQELIGCLATMELFINFYDILH